MDYHQTWCIKLSDILCWQNLSSTFTNQPDLMKHLWPFPKYRVFEQRNILQELWLNLNHTSHSLSTFCLLFQENSGSRFLCCYSTGWVEHNVMERILQVLLCNHVSAHRHLDFPDYIHERILPRDLSNSIYDYADEKLSICIVFSGIHKHLHGFLHPCRRLCHLSKVFLQVEGVRNRTDGFRTWLLHHLKCDSLCGGQGSCV